MTEVYEADLPENWFDPATETWLDEQCRGRYHYEGSKIVFHDINDAVSFKLIHGASLRKHDDAADNVYEVYAPYDSEREPWLDRHIGHGNWFRYNSGYVFHKLDDAMAFKIAFGGKMKEKNLNEDG